MIMAASFANNEDSTIATTRGIFLFGVVVVHPRTIILLVARLVHSGPALGAMIMMLRHGVRSGLGEETIGPTANKAGGDTAPIKDGTH
jgi:hypothetical protein